MSLRSKIWLYRIGRLLSLIQIITFSVASVMVMIRDFVFGHVFSGLVIYMLILGSFIFLSEILRLGHLLIIVRIYRDRGAGSEVRRIERKNSSVFRNEKKKSLKVRILRGIVLEYKYQTLAPRDFLEYLPSLYSEEEKKPYQYWLCKAKAMYLMGDYDAAVSIAEEALGRLDMMRRGKTTKTSDYRAFPIEVILRVCSVETGTVQCPPREYMIKNDPEMLLWRGIYNRYTGCEEEAYEDFKRLIEYGGDYNDAKEARKLITEERACDIVPQKIRLRETYLLSWEILSIIVFLVWIMIIYKSPLFWTSLSKIVSIF